MWEAIKGMTNPVTDSLPGRSWGGSCLEGGLQLLIFRQDAPLISPAHLAADPYHASGLVL